MKLRLIAAALALGLLGATGAQAAPAYTTANLNLRTGPDLDFPSAAEIPEGDAVDVHGCLNDESWCDVSWAGSRGWVYSEYLGIEERGAFTPLLDVDLPRYQIPVVVFEANDYWTRYYVGKPWYADHARWIAFKPRPRPGWRAPPPGPRNAGWWRTEYRAPGGMKGPPPGHDWRPPHRGPGGPGGPEGPGRPDGPEHRHDR